MFSARIVCVVLHRNNNSLFDHRGKKEFVLEVCPKLETAKSPRNFQKVSMYNIVFVLFELHWLDSRGEAPRTFSRVEEKYCHSGRGH